MLVTVGVRLFLLFNLMTSVACLSVPVVDLQNGCPDRPVNLPFHLDVNLVNRSAINCTIHFTVPGGDYCENRFSYSNTDGAQYQEPSAVPCWWLAITSGGSVLHESSCSLYPHVPYDGQRNGSTIMVIVDRYLSRSAQGKLLSRFLFKAIDCPPSSIGLYFGIPCGVGLCLVVVGVVLAVVLRRKVKKVFMNAGAECPEEIQMEEGPPEMVKLLSDPKPDEAKKVGLQAGDTVVFRNDPSEVRSLQVGHGEWHDDMLRILGETGRVVQVQDCGDVRVRMAQRTWTVHPACLVNKDDASSPDAVPAKPDSMSAESKRFFQAVTDCRIEVVEECLAANQNVNEARSIDGLTALHLASFHGHETLVSLLVDHDAKVDTPDVQGNTPLHHAAERNKTGVVRILLDRGAPVNQQNAAGSTALHSAAASGYLEVAQDLLDNDAIELNIKDGDGRTPLHLATINNHVTLVRVLVCAGDDIRAVDEDGFTAFQLAAKEGRCE